MCDNQQQIVALHTHTHTLSVCTTCVQYENNCYYPLQMCDCMLSGPRMSQVFGEHTHTQAARHYRVHDKAIVHKNDVQRQSKNTGVSIICDNMTSLSFENPTRNFARCSLLNTFQIAHDCDSETYCGSVDAANVMIQSGKRSAFVICLFVFWQCIQRQERLCKP